MNENSRLVVGMDLGDRQSALCWLDEEGEVLLRDSVVTSQEEIKAYFGDARPLLVVLEVGTHSPWVSRTLEALGHKVLIANPRRLKLISQSLRKSDVNDAELLARLGRADPKLLSPIKHRGEGTQQDLATVRVRHRLVSLRTSAINCLRGLLKSNGYRLPSCSADAFAKQCRPLIPDELSDTMAPLLRTIEQLTDEVKALTRRADKEFVDKYPETAELRKIGGVGPIVAATFVLTVETPDRFEFSRDVGPYLGLCPGRRQSGGRDPAQRITKAGDVQLRSLLVQAAQYILGANGPDCDLRDFGEKLVARGGKHAKAKAVVAVSRKLAVLMLKLWRTGDEYDPHHNRKMKGRRPKRVYQLAS